MSSKDRKYFRFRFYRVLALLFLFVTPTKTITIPESCLKLGNALLTSTTVKGEVLTDEFIKDLTQCLLSLDWQRLSDSAIQNFEELTAKMPSSIANSLKIGLFITSLYLSYRIYELYEEAVTLSENYMQHLQTLKEMQTKMQVVLQNIQKEVYSKPENLESTEIYEKIGKLLQRLNSFYTALEQLAEDVQKDIIKSGTNKGLAVGFGFTALAVCVGSAVFFADFKAFLMCVPTLGGAGCCWLTFSSLDETYNKLDQVREGTNKLRLKLVEHQTQLQVTHDLMTGPTVDVDIYIRSEGCDDPGRSHVSNTCGFACIRVNGKDFSPHGRGYNVVVVDGKTGKTLDARVFDTFGSFSNGDLLREYLNSLNGNKIVLVAIQEEGSKFINSALGALERVGATGPVMPDYRGSFVLVGYAGENKPAWIAQKIAKRGLGPSEISLKIPLALK